MMRSALSLLLICSILAQASVRTAWVLHYQWNRAVYLQNCENRNKPALHCDGKCYLKKKMAVQENNRSDAPVLPQQFFEIKDLQLFFEPGLVILLTAPLAEEHTQLPLYQPIRLESPCADIFKPPCLPPAIC